MVRAIAGNNSKGQRIRHAKARARISRRIAEADTADYHAILAMVPANFPDQNKFDVANSVVEELLSQDRPQSGPGARRLSRCGLQSDVPEQIRKVRRSPAVVVG